MAALFLYLAQSSSTRPGYRRRTMSDIPVQAAQPGQGLRQRAFITPRGELPDQHIKGLRRQKNPQAVDPEKPLFGYAALLQS